MKDIIIALSVVSAVFMAATVVMGIQLAKRKRVRNCDLCEDADDAIGLAIHEGVIDCSELSARDMADFLLQPASEELA